MYGWVLTVALAVAPQVKLGKAVETRAGAWSQSMTFTDGEGVHEVRFELSAPKSSDEGTSRQLTAVHRAGKKEQWRAKDFLEPCDLDWELRFVEGSFEVTDLDGDGLAEISFLYRNRCAGDVSPAVVKLLMYEGSTKYALRGESRERVSETELVGGTFSVDPAFEKAPASFVTFAKEKWKRFVAP